MRQRAWCTASRWSDETMTGSISSGPAAPVAPDAPMIPATPNDQATRGIRRTVILLGGAILAVAGVAVLVVALSARQPVAYPAGSPEAALQGYLSAWEADDLDTAYASFSDRVRAQATLDEYRSMDRDYRWAREQDRRVVLTGTRLSGDRATLDLRIDWFSSGGLLGGRSNWSENRTVVLVREDDAWHVDEYLAGIEPMWLEK
jgi:hypothetical protein